MSAKKPEHIDVIFAKSESVFGYALSLTNFSFWFSWFLCTKEIKATLECAISKQTSKAKVCHVHLITMQELKSIRT